jgi:hypothetical protein
MTGVRTSGQVQELGRVEADGAGGLEFGQAIVGLVEDPAEGSTLAPAAEALVEAVVPSLGQVLTDRREAAQMAGHEGHGADRVGDGPVVGWQERQVRRLETGTDELLPELDAPGARLVLQRVEAGGLAGFQGEIAAAEGTQGDLAASIEVEQDEAGCRLPFAG